MIDTNKLHLDDIGAPRAVVDCSACVLVASPSAAAVLPVAKPGEARE